MTGVRAASYPAAAAAQIPIRSSWTTVAPQLRAVAAVPSVEALSTTMTSAGNRVCRARACRQRSSSTASSRAGITTVTSSPRRPAGSGAGPRGACSVIASLRPW